jgi:hypothetical protein
MELAKTGVTDAAEVWIRRSDVSALRLADTREHIDRRPFEARKIPR